MKSKIPYIERIWTKTNCPASGETVIIAKLMFVNVYHSSKGTHPNMHSKVLACDFSIVWVKTSVWVYVICLYCQSNVSLLKISWEITAIFKSYLISDQSKTLGIYLMLQCIRKLIVFKSRGELSWYF